MRANVSIAAEDGLALPLEAGAQRVRHAPRRRDDHDAERHAGDENTKAGRPAAQFARGDAASSSGTPPFAASRRRPLSPLRRRHPMTSASAVSISISPSLMRIVAFRMLGQALIVRHEHQRGASCRRFSPNKISIDLPPVLRSRLPVGSSARMSFGRRLKARAMATRCCSPPESCAGKWSTRGVSPTSCEQLARRRERIRRCRQIQAAAPHSPAPSWSARDETTGRRCRWLGAADQRQLSSLSPNNDRPGHLDA